MSIRAATDALVANFEERSVPAVTPRDLMLPGLPGKADAVIGMRRVGKTWLCWQRIAELLAQGIPRSQMLYVNFEDERLLPLEADALHEVSDAHYRRHPASRQQPVHWFFDEIQNVPGWERYVRRLLDEQLGPIVVTGSSAKLLGREVATSLRGRSLASELSPFSFAEYLRHHGVEQPARWPPSDRARAHLENALGDYLNVGGFPEVQSLEPPLRVRVLQDYVDVVVFRDVVERHGVTNIEALRYLVRRLLSAPAGRFTVHRLYNDLRSQGRRVSKDLLYASLDHLEDAFLFVTITIDAESERARASNPRKCYPIDPGLARAHSFRADNTGHLLETLVLLALRRWGYDARYLQVDDLEVDFIARHPTEPPRLVQVCADMTDQATRARELRALSAGMKARGFDRAEVVTLTGAETLTVDGGTVDVVPAWRWLLGA
ncbi:MAG: ATP-binding protein [Myxococcales bacterium]|nr:ATP-binding protein [Myxococcales bacterium]